MVLGLNVSTLDNKLPEGSLSSDRRGSVPLATYFWLGFSFFLLGLSAHSAARGDEGTAIISLIHAYAGIAGALRIYDQANFPKK